MYDQKREALNLRFRVLVGSNRNYLRKNVFKPYVKIACMRLILFYQKRLSKGVGSCRYKPTCSQYTMECIHNYGVILGILLGCWRILRCNPLSKGGYDPAPIPYYKRKWLL